MFALGAKYHPRIWGVLFDSLSGIQPSWSMIRTVPVYTNINSTHIVRFHAEHNIFVICSIESYGSVFFPNFYINISILKILWQNSQNNPVLFIYFQNFIIKFLFHLYFKLYLFFCVLFFFAGKQNGITAVFLSQRGSAVDTTTSPLWHPAISTGSQNHG